MPEDIAERPVAQQRRALLLRSCRMMGVGTLLVLLVSDPMVDVLDSIGGRIGIPSFYVAFILAPLVGAGVCSLLYPCSPGWCGRMQLALSSLPWLVRACAACFIRGVPLGTRRGGGGSRGEAGHTLVLTRETWEGRWRDKVPRCQCVPYSCSLCEGGCMCGLVCVLPDGDPRARLRFTMCAQQKLLG